VQVELPEELANDVHSVLFRAAKPIRVATRYYTTFKTSKRFLQDSTDIREIEFRDAESNLLPQWLKDSGGEKQNFVFYPFGARYQYVYIGFGTNGDIAGVLPVQGPI